VIASPPTPPRAVLRTARGRQGRPHPAAGLVFSTLLAFALVFLLAGAALAQLPAGPHPSCGWTLLGPLAVLDGEGYDGSRVPVSGRVTAIALDPVAKRTVYVGTALGGVWRSDDAGGSWRPISDGAASPAIGALAADPRRPGRLYAGTGEANLALRERVIRRDRRLSGQAGAGFLHSEDGGETWELTGEDFFAGEAFAQIAIAPFDPDLLLAATTAGLFRSRDAGRSWEPLFGGLPREDPEKMATSVVFHPRRGEVAYAAFWSGGIYRGEAVAGSHPRWVRVGSGLPAEDLGRIGLAASAARPDDLYALISDRAGHQKGLYLSPDGGSHWAVIEGAPDLLGGQGFFNLLLAAHPTEERVVFLGGAGRSTRHPSSFYRGAEIGGRWRFQPLGGHLHVDFHALAFPPEQPDLFYVGNDGGVWRTVNGGGHWVNLNRGLPTLQFNRIDQHPRSGAFLIGGTQDNGTLIYRGHPVWEHVHDGDGGFVAIDPHDPSVIYSEFGLYRISRSTEGGRRGSFEPIVPEIKGVVSVLFAPFALDPGRPETLVVALDRIFLSSDGGERWQRISLDLSRGWASRFETNAVSALAFPRSDLLYAGTSDGKLWRLDRKPSHWQTRELDLPGRALGYLSDLAVDPREPNRLYAAHLGAEGPALWAISAPASGPVRWEPAWDGPGESPAGPTALPAAIFSLEIDRDDPKILYAGTDRGVFRSADRGESWSPFDRGLPPTSVFDLQHHLTQPLLRAATHGRGVWEIDLSGEPCPKTELYLRSSPSDQGRRWPSGRWPIPEELPGASRPADSPGVTDSPDIKVIAADPRLKEEISVFAYPELVTARPIAGGEYRIVVHLANRGPEAATARVRVYLARGLRPPEVEGGPGAPGGAWTLLGERQIEGVAMTAPKLATFPWHPGAEAPSGTHLLISVDTETAGAFPPFEELQRPARPEELALRHRGLALESLRVGRHTPEVPSPAGGERPERSVRDR